MPRLLALIAPLLVLLAVGALLREAPPADAPIEISTAAHQLDLRLTRAGGADVVLLGNSKVGTDLDPEAIASLFGTPTTVVPLGVKGTGMPVWYTVLQDRVYAAGYAPKLIIVYGPLAMMSQSALPTATQRAQLASQLTLPDPVINQKVFGEAFADPRLQAALDRRTTWHTSLMEGIRGLAVGALLAQPGAEPLAVRGNAHAAPALATLFEEENQKAGVRHVGPVVEAEIGEGASDGNVATTLIPDVVRLAHSHGAQVLFVRSPLGEAKRSIDAVPAELEPQVVALLGRVGAGYLDLRDADLSASAYGDGVHLSKAGRSRFTPELVEALRAVGVGGPRLAPAAPRPPRLHVTGARTGTPPTLPAIEPHRGTQPCNYTAKLVNWEGLGESALIGAGHGLVSPVVVFEDDKPLQMHALPELTAKTCGGAGYFVDDHVKFSPSGPGPESAEQHTYRLGLSADAPMIGGGWEEAWWVYPGTTVRLDVAGPPNGGVPTVRVKAAVTLEGAGIPTLSVAGSGGASFGRRGHALEAVATAPSAASGPWSIEVTSPADGPWLLLERVVTGTPEAPQYLVGKADPPTTVPLAQAEPAYSAAPPWLPLLTDPPAAAKEPNLWIYDVSSFGVPSHGEVFDAAGTGCSPLDLLEDGKPIKEILGADGKPIMKLTHTGAGAKVSFSDGRDPNAGDHVYTFRLDPSRVCGKHKGLWLYPGDELTLRVGPDALSALISGATQLDLGGAVAPAGVFGTLHVSLVVDDVETLSQTIPTSAFPVPPLDLRGTVSPEAQSAVLRLQLESPRAYLLITTADLVEAAPLPLGG
ncbi:hypothetical protein LBMAG42_13520 [Deltaproteobacteria bacterium]|nr:hypothetical protein LBMAG42_13520 [Deltaproteobacteria bacterium]